jgi:hypothetical protein
LEQLVHVPHETAPLALELCEIFRWRLALAIFAFAIFAFASAIRAPTIFAHVEHETAALALERLALAIFAFAIFAFASAIRAPTIFAHAISAARRATATALGRD